MKAKALNESYSICGKEYCFYVKTGSYKKEEGDPFYKFLKIGVEEGYDKYDSENTAFVIPLEQKLASEFDIKNGDHVSMALFGEDSQTYFLLINHRNSIYKYYPYAFEDLYWTRRDEDSGWLKRLIINYRLNKTLKEAGESFAHTQAFSRVLTKLKASNPNGTENKNA